MTMDARFPYLKPHLAAETLESTNVLPPGWDYLNWVEIHPTIDRLMTGVRDPLGHEHVLHASLKSHSTSLTVATSLLTNFRSLLQSCGVTPRW